MGERKETFDFKLKYKCYIAGGVWNFTFRFTENTLDFYKENPPPPPLNKIQLNMKKGQKYPKNCKIYLQMLDVKPSNRTYIQFRNYQ